MMTIEDLITILRYLGDKSVHHDHTLPEHLWRLVADKQLYVEDVCRMAADEIESLSKLLRIEADMNNANHDESNKDCQGFENIRRRGVNTVMDDNIKEKVRDIATALRYCMAMGGDCEQCPVYEKGVTCQNDPNAAEMLEYLYKELVKANELAERRLKRKNMYKERSERELAEKILLRLELEAAKRDLKHVLSNCTKLEGCLLCKHLDINGECYHDCNFEPYETWAWDWRGLYKENGGAKDD